MQFAPQLFRAVAAIGILISAPSVAAQGDIRIQVLDRDGAPVPEVAVYARPIGSVDSAAGSSANANAYAAAAAAAMDPVAAPLKTQPAPTMNQHNLSFSPHLLIVETGTAVAFPNDDDVRHHVYSFSKAKRLNMTVDSHTVHVDQPVFDTPGVVTLGCNIHDNMLAYVLVVDTPHFAMTDADGAATLSALSAGQFEIKIWTPRISEDDLPEPEILTIRASDSLQIGFQFDDKLFPPHEHSETSLHWADY